MSQAAAQQPSRKKAVISLLVLLALTCIIVFTFKDHWAEISAALAQLSLGQVALVLALGITYPLLEGVASWWRFWRSASATPCWKGAWRGSSCAAVCRSSNCGRGWM